VLVTYETYVLHVWTHKFRISHGKFRGWGCKHPLHCVHTKSWRLRQNGLDYALMVLCGANTNDSCGCVMTVWMSHDSKKVALNYRFIALYGVNMYNWYEWVMTHRMNQFWRFFWRIARCGANTHAIWVGRDSYGLSEIIHICTFIYIYKYTMTSYIHIHT